jgi:hypothetical protein
MECRSDVLYTMESFDDALCWVVVDEIVGKI